MNLPIPRSTSLAAWQSLLNSDKLSKLYREVIRALYHNGPSTAKEIEFHSKKSGIWKRTSELRAAGFIEETRKRACSITGEEAVEWGLPEKPPEDFDALVLYFKVEGILGYTNRTWINQTRFISLRRNRTIEARLETAFKKASSHVEFAKITSYTEVTEEAYEAGLATESLPEEDVMKVNLITQAAHEVCDQIARLPTTLKSCIDRRAVKEFDDLDTIIDTFGKEIKYVINEARTIVVNAS